MHWYVDWLINCIDNICYEYLIVGVKYLWHEDVFVVLSITENWLPQMDCGVEHSTHLVCGMCGSYCTCQTMCTFPDGNHLLH
jgi:hypothetical protein